MDPKGFVPIILLVILGVVLIIGGIWYYAENHLTNTTTSSVTADSSASSSTNVSSTGATSTSPLDTSGWQTYQNDYYSFKYPTGWAANNPRRDIHSVTLWAGNPRTSSGTFLDSISIDPSPFIPEPQMSSIQESVAFIHERGDDIMVQPKEYHVQNGDAFYWTFPAGGMNEEHGVHAYLASDNDVYHMGYLAETQPNASLEDQQKIMVSILSTFKFLDVKSQYHSVYFNEIYGFGFDYPSDWEVSEASSTNGMAEVHVKPPATDQPGIVVSISPDIGGQNISDFCSTLTHVLECKNGWSGDNVYYARAITTGQLQFSREQQLYAIFENRKASVGMAVLLTDQDGKPLPQSDKSKIVFDEILQSFYEP